MNELIKKRRGKGVDPAMIYLPIRISKEASDFLNAYPNKSAKIREILDSYIKQHGETNEENIKSRTDINVYRHAPER